MRTPLLCMMRLMYTGRHRVTTAECSSQALGDTRSITAWSTCRGGRALATAVACPAVVQALRLPLAVKVSVPRACGGPACIP